MKNKMKELFSGDSKVLESKILQLNANINLLIHSTLKEALSKKLIWGSYKALAQEAPHELTLEMQALSFAPYQISWVYPRVEGAGLHFFLSKKFEKTELGFLAPTAESAAVELKEIFGLLIPGLAFTKTGQRLGRGKGYFDRTLVGWSGIKVGVCFEEQLVLQIPTDSWDTEMDFVVTDSAIIDCRRKG